MAGIIVDCALRVKNSSIHWEATILGAFRSSAIPNGRPGLSQNLYKSYTGPTRNSRISAPIFRLESARKHAPEAPPFPPFLGRFLMKSDASLLMHFFRAAFTPFCPFSLWSEPQYPVMHHFLGKCNSFAAPFAPSAPAPKDRPSAIEMMNRSPPHKLYKTAKTAPPRPPPQANVHM